MARRYAFFSKENSGPDPINLIYFTICIYIYKIDKYIYLALRTRKRYTHVYIYVYVLRYEVSQNVTVNC